MSRMAYEELLLSPVGALARYRDADDRPLCGEALITDPEFRGQLELKRCPYAGVRRHHRLPMNVSALKQMKRHWPSVLGAAQLVRRALDGATAAGRGPEPAHLARVAHAAVCLPLYLLYRAASPMRDGEVPGFASGLHKASIDIATAARLLLVRAHGGDAWTGGLLEFAEHHELWIGAAGVCAGPPHMIDELIGVMTGDRAGPSIDSGHARQALGDLTGLVGYADALLELTVARHLIGAWLRRRMDALVARCASIAAADPGAREPTERLRDAVARHPVPARPSAILQHQDRLLRELPTAAYTALLDAVEHHRATLSSSSAGGAELLGHVRGSAPPDRAEVAHVIDLADRRPGDPGTAAIAEAIVDSARLQQRALAFLSSVEVAIGRALGRADRPPRLTSDELARVFGAPPARYLGRVLDLDVEVTDDRISYSRCCERSRRLACHSISAEPLHANQLDVEVASESPTRPGALSRRSVQ